MKKYNYLAVLFFVGYTSYAQVADTQLTGDDITSIKINSFSSQNNIGGLIQNSVEEVTGKVNISIPIATVNSRSISYPINLGYNGKNVFKQGQYQNRYKSTSTVGVGWTLATPKIVVDTKQTATRDDDTFYFNGSKLIATNKVDTPFPSIGYAYLEFQMEKFQPWKVRYYISYTDLIFGGPQDGQRVVTSLDYWEVTNENGIVSRYGTSLGSKESVIVWGNWTGDSNESGGEEHTVIWNLSYMKDQWNNNITFEYEIQESGMKGNTSLKQTEATYIKKIISSTGENVQFNYDIKNNYEYYEPHIEQVEPDSYQERYEKKYLQDIKVYNSSNSLVYTYDLTYDISTEVSLENRKRYLKTIVQKSNTNESLPQQQFEYYTSGDFKGGLKKVTYPLGGSITYNYLKKDLFTNLSTPIGNTTGYRRVAEFVGENYRLTLLYQGNEPIFNSGNRVTKLIRHSYEGNNDWVRDDFIFTDQLYYKMNNNNLQDIENIKFVFGKDFYGAITYKDDFAKMHLFHLNKDGHTWHNFIVNGIYVGPDGDDPNTEPSFISGDNFVAIGPNKHGHLRTYIWNGSTWLHEIIDQGPGQYYYEANNNFIISLDEDGGPDMITGTSHEDNYYIHYLDAEKKWRTKSWSAFADPYIAGIEKPSHFYPSNSISAFVADDNPEFFLRWDKDYNLIAIDNVLGGYNDNNPINISNTLFSIHQYDNANLRMLKAAQFNGASWNLNYFSNLNIDGNGSGENKILTFGYNNNTWGHTLHNFDVNTNTWSNINLQVLPDSYFQPISYGIVSDFFVAGNYAYKINNNGYSLLGLVAPENSGGSYSTKLVLSNGIDNIHVKYKNRWTNDFSVNLLHINKKDGSLFRQNSAFISYLGSYNLFKRFGGSYPFLSNSVIGGSGLFRIINNKINSQVDDIVVSSLLINDDEGNLRIISYEYNNHYLLTDGETKFYGEVIVENKGSGSSSTGQIKKYFNTGTTDIQMAGLPIREEIFDVNGNKKQENVTTWQKFLKNYFNGGTYVIEFGHYLRITKQTTKLFFDNNNSVITETDNSYNTNGLLFETITTNSKEQIKYSHSKFAYENYSFVNDANILNLPYETTNKVDGTIVSYEKSVWKLDNGRVYPFENWSGTNTSNIRLNSIITKTDDFGNITESDNGKGVFTSVIHAYNSLYEVASISNTTESEVLNQLDVSLIQLQNLNTNNLKIELLKLYDRLPNAFITLTFYDENGNIISKIDNRKEEINYYYDSFGRLDYVTDSNDNKLKQFEYNYKN